MRSCCEVYRTFRLKRDILITMNPRTTSFFIGTMVVAMFTAGIIVYSHMPSSAASHWDMAGRATGFLPRFWAAFLAPSIALALWGLWALLPKIDPIAPGFKGFRYAYDFIWVLLTAFLAYIYALTLWANLGVSINMAYFVMPAVALLFIVLGAILPLIKRNWFVGIRTPWTLSSDLVWEKTHKVAAWLFILAGVIVGISTFTSLTQNLWVILTPLLLAALVPVAYSYILFLREKSS